MDEIGLSELMQLIIRDKGGTPQQYNQLMDYIAYHETGPEQRMDPKAKQISGNEKEGFYDGPGRGLFMFEVGEKKGGNTAVNRTVKYFKDNNLPLPKWLYDLSMGSKESKSVDVSSLSADQQKMLFLGNHREHPNSNFSNIWTGQQAISDFWLKNHWSGDPDDSVIKLDLFNKNMLAKDSTDALKVREEELMYKQNMAPYLSDSNNINNLPTEKNILDSIFGAQDSSLIKEYSHGGVHLPVAESDATNVAPVITPTKGTAPVLTKKMYDIIKASQHNQNILSNKIKRNYLQKLLSGYYNMTRYGNNPHFSQDPEVQRSWWDKITDISSNYRNMGKK